MLFSAVIPAYNAAATLDETLASVASQSWRDFEAVVVDDGSTDKTAEIAARWAGREQRIRLIGSREGNRGVAAARNLGIAHARGEAIAFLDADDLWRPDALASFAAALDQNPRADVVYAMAERLGRSQGTLLGRGQPGIPVGLFRQLARFNVAVTSAVAVRRQALNTRPFPPGLPFQFEDWACWLELSRRHAFLFVPTVVAGYRTVPWGAMARVTSSGHEAAFAAEMVVHLASRLPDFGKDEQDHGMAGLLFRVTEAVLFALHLTHLGRFRQAMLWLRVPAVVARHPTVLLKAAANVIPEQRRINRGLDPPLSVLPPPEIRKHRADDPPLHSESLGVKPSR